MTLRHRHPKSRSGFSLIELLMVIAVIAFLISISAAFYANYVQTAREQTTAATIKMIHEQLNQRIEAFNRALKIPQTAINQRRRTLGIFGVSDDALEILVRKDRFREAFPQRFSETSRLIPPASPPHRATTESAELLYFILTGAEVYGIPPVDDSEFNASQVADTDGDGLLEFVDAWRQPLRFYRWPTRLIKPDGININRAQADLLIKGLPSAPPAGQRDQLNEDPDDMIGRLTTLSPVNLSSAVNENTYHTLDTYHAPLIVSAGADGVLGLFEPYQAGPNYGTLARPNGNVDALTDNITNRNSRAGGN